MRPRGRRGHHELRRERRGIDSVVVGVERVGAVDADEDSVVADEGDLESEDSIAKVLERECVVEAEAPEVGLEREALSNEQKRCEIGSRLREDAVFGDARGCSTRS